MNNNKTDTVGIKKSNRQTGYLINKVKIEPYRVIFVLNGEKDGCREIVVEGTETPIIKDILLRFFENPQGYFDFTIIKKLGNRQCKISEIERIIS